MSSLRLSRTTRGALAAMLVAAAVALVPPPASAAPEPPTDAPSATQRLQDLSREAERLTEDWNAARDALTAAQTALGVAQTDFTAATAAGDLARTRQQEFQGQVDLFTGASFEGARLNQLSALLVSDDPQEFLDQMSALDLLATDNNEALRQLADAVAQAEEAERAAADAQTRATEAEAAAVTVEADLATKREDMDRQIAVVRDQLDTLTADERITYQSAGVTDTPVDPPAAVAGASGAAATAVQAALSKQGSPYSWGAEGPNSFDCSGLMQWAYAQAGVDLPRSSREQARVGTAVTRDQLQPGDLIALYSPVSHIGMYVGGDTYVDAPTEGQNVDQRKIPWGDVTAMRRVG